MCAHVYCGVLSSILYTTFDQQVMNIQDDIEFYNTIIENKTRQLTDIEKLFEAKIQNNEFAKYLKRIFKKKLKLPKVKSASDDGNVYESLL